MKNDDNLTFYDKIDLDKFKEFASMIGVDKGLGMEEVYPFIKNKKSVIELGAGYGRVIDFLIKKKFKGKILAIDRIPWLVNYLQKKYSEENISIIEQDIKNLRVSDTVDVVLWMWSGLLELSPKEQFKTIKNIFHSISKEGLLVIETPYQEVRYVGEFQSSKEIHFEAEWGHIDAYLTDYKEMELFAKEAGFTELTSKIYTTSKNLERVIYFLKK